jgi:serine/threonine protein kinase
LTCGRVRPAEESHYIIERMTRFAQRFVLERQIGAGGMARVFLGRDEVLDRLVAIKILREGFEDSEVGARFRREGRTAARLSHPNIVQVYDAGKGEFEGREVSYIVMEYVSGGDLKGLIDGKGPLSDAKLAWLGAQVTLGLAHAHKKGVIHRDIKPHNILIDAYGHSKLTDFGIARALDATEATQTGSYLGTALYSSPEQLRGEKVTPKSDVYSLGITLYQAAADQTPFTGTPIAVASQHVNRTPTPPSVLGARLSKEVEALILDCLQKDPNLRPTAGEIHERLSETAGMTHATRDQAPPPISVTPVETEEHTYALSPEVPPTRSSPAEIRHEDDRDQRRRRRPILLVAATLLLVALGVVTAFAALGGDTGELAQTASENQQASSSEEPSAGGEGTVPAQEQTTQGKSGSSRGGSDTGAAAAQAVKDFYTSAAEKDYGRSSNLLTAAARQRYFPSRDYFEGTFGTLNRIRFPQEPTAEVSGNTATVTGETIAEHTNRTEQNRGTWTLVNEGGQWKLDRWNVENERYL